MTEPVETVTAGERAQGAWERMHAEHIHHLVVVENSHVVGVLSERDLGGAHGEPVRADTTVRDLMVGAPITVEPELHLKDAANLMRGRSIGCLPVTDSRGKLVGIVTVTDMLAALGTTSERPVERGKRWTLKHRGPRAGRAKTRAS